MQRKHVVLKDQTLMTTEELYQKVRAAEEATHKMGRSTGRRRNRRASQAALVGADDAQDIKEENQAIIDNIIEVLGG